MTPALELRGITRTFGPTIATRDAHLTVNPGEIHAVVGENGAGKSTLLQIAAGLLTADTGEIRVNGEPLLRPSPTRAIARGIGMVQQHFLLIPTFSVAENVVLGAEPHQGPVLDRSRAEADVRALSDRFGMGLEPSRPVGSLSVGEQQRVEILKVLYRNASILILDEPTSVLAPVEVEELFRVLRSLVAQGRTVVFVTHKLREVMAIADRVTVMQRGRVVETVRTADTSIAALTRSMVGETAGGQLLEVIQAVQGATPIPGVGSSRVDAEPAPVLHIDRLRVRSPQGLELVRGISLELRPGEIVGIAGVQGNGQTELIDAIAGLTPYDGEIRLAGVSIDAHPPGSRLEAGIAHIPEDRHHRGLVLDFSIADNLILGTLRRFSRGFRLDRTRILARAADAIARFDIRPPRPEVTARTLSGGNQQKIVVARELDRAPKVLLAAQPTRGVDIGAMAHIHEALRTARDAGTAILLVSADLGELLALADRIGVMYRGELVGMMPRALATEARLGTLMVGGQVHD